MYVFTAASTEYNKVDYSSLHTHHLTVSVFEFENMEIVSTFCACCFFFLLLEELNFAHFVNFVLHHATQKQEI